MTYTAPTITVTPAGGATYTMTAVQSVSINAGRQFVTDNWQARTFQMEFIPNNSSYIPKATDLVEMTNGGTKVFFRGWVTESQRTYQIPYNASTGQSPGDRVTVTAQAPLGKTGQVNVSWSATGAVWKAQQVLVKIMADTGVSITTAGSYYWNPNLNPTATTISGTGYALDMVNELARTANWLILDDYDKLCFMNPQTDAVYYTFTDSGSGIKYNDIEYVSSTRNQFNVVNVQQYSGTAQSASTGATYANTWNLQTYFADNNTDAASLASYSLNTLNPASPSPYRISVSTTLSNATDPQDLFIQRTTGANKFLGYLSTVTLRGSTVYVIPQGLSATWYPDRMVGNVFFMPSLGTAFTLNSVSNGVLNQNVLGL